MVTDWSNQFTNQLEMAYNKGVKTPLEMAYNKGVKTPFSYQPVRNGVW